MEKSQARLDILKKIDEYERKEWWDRDVEDDPETIELLPNKVDYLNKKLSSKISTWIANKVGTSFFEKMLKNGQMIIEDIVGIENFLAVKGGAIVTCNHFNACDNYAVWRAFKPYMKRKRLFKVIREGNFTNPPAPFGFIMRHCNTLPLSSNRDTMRKFLSAIDVLLKRGEKILVYPEQGMWWNYRKPRPMKDGAFRFAVSSNVPVLPVFITMRDSDMLDGDGFFVQKYTVNILPAIYPDENLNKKQNIEKLKTENYNAWVDVYEKFYNTKLEYLREEKWFYISVRFWAQWF